MSQVVLEFMIVSLFLGRSQVYSKRTPMDELGNDNFDVPLEADVRLTAF